MGKGQKSLLYCVVRRQLGNKDSGAIPGQRKERRNGQFVYFNSFAVALVEHCFHCNIFHFNNYLPALPESAKGAILRSTLEDYPDQGRSASGDTKTLVFCQVEIFYLLF